MPHILQSLSACFLCEIEKHLVNFTSNHSCISSFAFCVEIFLPKACNRVFKTNPKAPNICYGQWHWCRSTKVKHKKVCKEALEYGKSVYKSIKLESNSTPLVECVSRGLCCAGAHYKSKWGEAQRRTADCGDLERMSSISNAIQSSIFSSMYHWGRLLGYLPNFAILFLFFKKFLLIWILSEKWKWKFLFYLKYKENMCGSWLASQFTPPIPPFFTFTFVTKRKERNV